VPAEPVAVAASNAQVASASPVAVKRPAAVALPQTEPGPFDRLIENPILPVSAIALTALLAFFGFYRASKRKSRSTSDSVFLESRLRPDSFFGASGGQSIDTHDSAATGSSMAYSPSQLDAVDNVDPVAEADVYLAYGRDLQAEEILKDALQTNPDRLAIHQKLLVIFAKRSDQKSFERIAALAYKLTNGVGSDWERICELGLSIDPSNALYLPGGQPGKPNAPVMQSSEVDNDDLSVGNTQTLATQAVEPQSSGLIDLDLDFSVDQEKPHQPTEPSAHDALTKPAGVDNDLTVQATTSFVTSGPAPLKPARETTPNPNPEMLKFDLGSLSLDLDDDAASGDEGATSSASVDDPLVTKLALANEFTAIGKHDGARALIKEVLSEASGDMKIKAQSALNNL
jgi:pilus assembly protein FimV